ncbi:hypothetical protein L596_017107 [Steinernema carpocapsae]|nr:hypothetical protein L596_017107 [Steinernema carpocapsae]
MIDHSYISRRVKFIHSRETLRLLVKCSTEVKKDENFVSLKRAPMLRIRHLSWNNIFAGPEPAFEHTERKRKIAAAKEQAAPQKVRKSVAKDGPKEQTTLNKFFKPAQKIPKKNLAQRIASQQEQIKKSLDLIEHTGHDVSRWRQNERLLTGKDMSDLTALVQEVQKAEAARKEAERKAKEKEAKQEWKKPRDDLECDDLKPLPEFQELKLPDWLTTDMLLRCMAICQFIDCFSSLMSLKEHLKSSKVTLDKVLYAVMCNDANMSTFVPIMQALLALRAECGAEEDGDEADPKDMVEGAEWADYDHEEYGEQIREATERHQIIRDAFGDSVRDLPVDWMTITEALRMNLVTAGYYSGQSVQNFRMRARGGCHLYDDPCFRFVDERPEFLAKFETMSVFEMEPEDRLKLMELVTEQLLTYRKLRMQFEERAEASVNLVRERKVLRKWFAGEEANATQAQQDIEAGSYQPKKQTENTTKIVRYVKNMNEGRRVQNTREVEALLMKDVHYNQMDLGEIVAVREFQKELFEVKEAKLTEQIERASALNIGCYLGRDRAYHSYYFIDSANLLIRLSPTESEIIPECDKATPIEKLPKGISRLDYQKAIYACTGSKDTCHSHKPREDDAQEISYFANVPDLETFFKALNLRGYREKELADMFAPLMPKLTKAVEQFAANPAITEIEEENLNPETPLKWNDEVALLLLEFEEKLYKGGIAQLPYDRDEWRQKLTENFDTTSFVPKEGVILVGSEESYYTKEQLQALSLTQKLSIALLQLVQCVHVGFFNYPFVDLNVEKPWESEVLDCYSLWQRQLVAAHSLTEICMFYKRVTSFVRWEASRFQAKCKACRKRGDASELAICVECTRATHTRCMRTKIPAVSEGPWTCPNCKRRITKAEARATSVAESVQDEEDEKDDDFSDVVYQAKPKNARTSRLIVNSFDADAPRTTRKRYFFDDEDDSQNEEANSEIDETEEESQSYSPIYQNGIEDEDENFEPHAKRSRPQRSNASVYRKTTEATAHNLRRNKGKDIVKKVEPILKDAMRREDSWPFSQPVDPKEVPDYLEIIKHPMDLRTMMNKLKNNDYEEMDDVVADYQLIFQNCREYNSEDSEINELARTLENFMNEQFDALKAESLNNSETGIRRDGRERRAARVIYNQ